MSDQDSYLFLYDLSLYRGGGVPAPALPGTPQGGTCLWQFDGKEWRLLKDACTAGYEPGKPPKGPGAFRGEIKKTMGVAR